MAFLGRITGCVTPLAAVVALSLSCSSSEDPTPQCERELVGGRCAGLTMPELCAGDYCTAGAACSRVIHVAQGAAAGAADGSSQRPFATLGDAAAEARAGECIALAAGSYEGAKLPAGVSVLGAGAQRVTVSGTLAVPGGAGSLLRGFSLDSDGVGLALAGLDGARITEVRVKRARGVGIDARGCTNLELQNVAIDAVAAADEGHGIGLLLAEGSTAEVSGCAIDGSATQGVLAHGSAIALVDSSVTGSGMFGVVVDCSACQGTPASRISSTTIDGVAGIGLLVVGGVLEATDNDIGGTTYKDGFARNVQIQQQAAVTLKSNRIHHSQGQGVVIDDATGTLKSNTIENNEERGAVVQNAAGALLFEDNAILANEHAGLAALSSTGLTIKGGRIAGTLTRVVIVDGDHDQVGDGVQILVQSAVALEAVKIEDNGRLGVIIDGAKATIAASTISGGEVPLVVQNAAVADQTFADLVDAGGNAVTPVSPDATFLVHDEDLVSTLPIPIPKGD